jgi:formylglycine-generating enzyme required for sulfatase activity
MRTFFVGELNENIDWGIKKIPLVKSVKVNSPIDKKEATDTLIYKQAGKTTEKDSDSEALTMPGLGMKFVEVLPGKFTMVVGNSRGDELASVQVTMRVPYLIGKYEVTQKEYREIMGRNPSYVIGDDKPVNRISWLEMVEFCKKLTKYAKRKHFLKSGVVCRLPTEAEWEYAARGGKYSRGYLYSGSNTTSDVAWSTENSGRIIHDVGLKKANELGIHDMSGNVWELCHDRYAPIAGNKLINPIGAKEGKERVARGGCRGSSNVKILRRIGVNPLAKGNIRGFRVVIGPEL